MNKLNKHEKDLVSRLEQMSIKEARLALAAKEFGEIDSQNYIFCSSWLATKESELRDANAFEAARWARHAAYAAYAAAIIAIISITITIFKTSP